MGRRLFAVLVAMFCVLFALSAASKRDGGAMLRYGMEWGVSPVILTYHDYTYATEAGPVIQDSGVDGCFNVEGYILGFVGIDAGECMTFAFKSGFCGLNGQRRAIPALVGVQWHRFSLYDDGPLAYLDGGVGISVASNPMVRHLFRAGAGWHEQLAGKMGVDFTAGVSFAGDRPRILDKYTGGYVSEQSIRHDEAAYFALTIGIALSF